MVTKAIRRKNKTTKQNEKDFYQTHPAMVKALIDEVDIDPRIKILDPCNGKKVIQRGLSEYFVNVKGFDKFSGFPRKNFLTHKIRYDMIVMNPPYSAKYKFIDHARKIADTVVCLLPINISNYNMFHTDYEDTPGFVGKIVMTPKMFLSETTTFKTGGTSAYAWYIWDKNNNTKSSITWYKNLRDFL